MQTRFLFCDGDKDAIALIEAKSGRAATYGELDAASAACADLLSGPKALVFHVTENTIDSVVSLLGCLRAGQSVALISPTLVEQPRAGLDTLYQPDFIISSLSLASHDDYCLRNEALGLYERKVRPVRSIHPDLGVMLSTSGSTGSPKFVRLSHGGLAHNATAIAKALDIKADDIGYGHLQLHYSYGLSVLTSHLSKGARVVLTDAGLMQPAFWADARAHAITHFPGVPFHYEMMMKLGLARLKLPAIRTMTQAGGRLGLELQTKMHDWQSQNGGSFFVMYGQTEAAPRITTLPHALLPEKLGSVGPSLEGGEIIIADPTGQPVAMGQTGEVIYCGPNVMMGYATCSDDLALPDQMGGRLATGDMGKLDKDGYLFITGRASRFAKIAGLRIGLDEIEHALGVGTAATGTDQKLIIWCLPTAPMDSEAILSLLDSRFGLARSLCKVVEIDLFPVLENGKRNYKALQEMSSSC
jgi:acyl-coenzyme A synthetase/AMP-(fatty) acid ligase